MSKQITLICEVDDKKFKTDSKLIQRSGFLRSLLEQYEEETEFKIPQIKSAQMELIIEWLDKHRDEEPKIPPQPLRNYDIEEVVGKWESDFINKVWNNSFDSLFSFPSKSIFNSLIWSSKFSKFSILFL